MKFRHTLSVFVDNFSITYKQLLYRAIITLISALIVFLGISPFVRGVLPELNALTSSALNFVKRLLSGHVEDLNELSEKVYQAFEALMAMLDAKKMQIVLCGILLLAVYLVQSWFAGLGNYATAAVINDKMALQAQTPFFATLIKNLKKSTVYNLIYVPLSILYDLLIGIGMFFFSFFLLNTFLPFFICAFLFVCVLIFAIAVKMTFTTDWLPALIRGKTGQGEAFVYTLSRKGKNTFNVLSNFIVIILIIFGLNAAAILLTFGVGALITIPASYVILLSFEFVNYYDREELKYFIDKETIIKHGKERELTREEFFRGDTD